MNNSINKELIVFIKKARDRGFDDIEIKSALLEKGWPQRTIDESFLEIYKEEKDNIDKKGMNESYKNQIIFYLDNELLKMIEKRAKKNLMTVPEQIEDIIRRSCIRSKTIKNYGNEKIDDLLINVFSRRKTTKKS